MITWRGGGNLRIGTFRYIEDILHDYPSTDQYIREREQQIVVPYWPGDEVTTERSQDGSKHRQTRVAITIATDRYLRLLRENQAVIAETLAESDEDTRAIITALYFKRNSILTITGVAYQLHIGRTTASRKRTRFFNTVAKRLGFRC